MAFAVDSVNVLDPQALVDLGVTTVLRYLPTRHQSFGCSRAELDTYLHRGLSIALIFEEGGNEFLGGYAAGVDNARRAIESRNSLGLSFNDLTLYFCLGDPNPTVVWGHEHQLREYVRGLRDTIDCPLGGYGSLYALRIAREVVEDMKAWGVETWGWIGAPDSVDLLQLPNAGYLNVAGVNVDRNAVVTTDHGQYPRPSGAVVTQEINPTMATLAHELNPDGGGVGFHYFDGSVSRYFGEGDPSMTALEANPAVVKVDLPSADVLKVYSRLNALPAYTTIVPTDVDLVAFATAVTEGLKNFVKGL